MNPAANYVYLNPKKGKVKERGSKTFAFVILHSRAYHTAYGKFHVIYFLFSLISRIFCFPSGALRSPEHFPTVEETNRESRISSSNIRAKFGLSLCIYLLKRRKRRVVVRTSRGGVQGERQRKKRQKVNRYSAEIR